VSIPALIVPILTQPELLDRMLRSIDHPIDTIVVIDNGDVTVDWDMGHDMVLDRVIRPGHNLGVAASWNLGIKVTPQAPWWLIVNHDIEFGPGDLGRLEEAVDPRAGAVYFMFGMASFAITRPTLQAAGWADENIHPAYDEDLDWHRRMQLAGVVTVETGFTGKHVGSATIMSDPVLRAANGATHGANDAYYAQKWGGPKAGGETFQTPFDKGGHQGDWRLDIERLRNQAWPRRG
jgi:hypothetical protein